MCFLALPSFHRYQHFLAPGPLPSSESAMTVTSFSCCLTMTMTLLPFSSMFKDPCDYIGPIWMIQDNLPILRRAA